ncbi:RNA polymerase subunit sigma [Streptomyces sp. SS1-1]|uniref:RNA polymerase subunit sigma n=1 Tax=Streptomyces sp. SS1-1 TaxID=2651869 RepID=UPI00125061ED|nr:RNA polymerase subunit sigma [Streptomyces sp. SS1-1]KAB2976231.1 RNA polymerase subunit sigma [Streptomyces sp. SS1-1]
MEPVADTMPIGELLDERRHLLEVAHWMLGDGALAEYVTDEAYREWYRLSEHQQGRVGAPRAWLTRAVGSIALARLGLSEHEIQRAPQGAVRSRAVFDPCLEDDLGALPAPSSRARHSLRDRTARPTPPRAQDEAVEAVRQACVDQDADRLAGLLDPGAVAFYDGGGKVRALTRPVVGGPRVARSLLTLLARNPRTTLHTRSVNGRTGLVVRYEGRVAAVVCLDMAGSRVVQVWAVLNPDKLRSWNFPRV